MSVVSDSVRPHRRQPTKLPNPWDSPGKSTGVGCHCLLPYLFTSLPKSLTSSHLWDANDHPPLPGRRGEKTLTTGGPGKEQGTNKLPPTRILQRSTRGQQENATRASDQAEGDARRFDNSALIREILQIRREEAQLLGRANFGELSLVPKMAQSPKQVTDFLRELARRARPYAERDVADMRAFAREHLALDDPQAWDWPYIAERLKEARYAFSEQEVRQYFPAPKVLAGLFDVTQKLFGVRIRPGEAPVWHPDVAFYRIERDDRQGGTRLVGRFYLDPTARNGKRGGAWMDDMRSRWLRPDDGMLQTPVAQLVCNFPQGSGGKPALLTHDEVTTLFHEFGHGLHHMLTLVDEHDVSGISGVEWDAVELPSQFMENFCWEWEVLQRMTAHADTGAPLPRALFDKMRAARTPFGSFGPGCRTS